MKFRESVRQVSRHANASLYMPFSGSHSFVEWALRRSIGFLLRKRLKCELFTSSSDHDIAAYDVHTWNVAHREVHSGGSSVFADMYRCKYVHFTVL